MNEAGHVFRPAPHYIYFNAYLRSAFLEKMQSLQSCVGYNGQRNNTSKGAHMNNILLSWGQACVYWQTNNTFNGWTQHQSGLDGMIPKGKTASDLVPVSHQ